jgi:hypothetical protein
MGASYYIILLKSNLNQSQPFETISAWNLYFSFTSTMISCRLFYAWWWLCWFSAIRWTIWDMIIFQGLPSKWYVHRQGFKFCDWIRGKKETKGVNVEKRRDAMHCMDRPTHSSSININTHHRYFLHSLIFALGLKLWETTIDNNVIKHYFNWNLSFNCQVYWLMKMDNINM